MSALKNQFLFDLEIIYDVEHRIAKALPKMIKSDTSDDLKLAILSHARNTEEHVTKVEQIFECFGHSAGGKAEDATADDFSSSVASDDAALISALKTVEHHGTPSAGCQREWEIASYGCLNEWAKLLGNSEAADLLEQILEEEDADRQGEPDHPRRITDWVM